MAFLFASSHLPETGAPHPEEEEEEMVDPQSLPRAGMVRAFSHLPQAVRRVVKVPAETPPRGAEAEREADSGFGGAARGEAEGEEKTPAPGRPRPPGLLFEKRPTPGFAPGKGRAEYHDLVDQLQDGTGHKSEFGDDAGKPQAPLNKAEPYDIVYHTHEQPPPKSEFHDLFQPFKGSPGEAKEQTRVLFQNVSAKSKNPAPQPPSNPPTAPNQTTNPPPAPKPSTTRLLTEGEKKLVRSIFGDSIRDLDKVEIHHHSYFPFQPPGTTVAPNGNIYLGKNLRGIRDFSKSWYDRHAELMHEMTHVWQRQNGMNVVLRRILKPFATYHYVIEDGKPFHKYTMEQQATIVEDYVRSLHGETLVKHRGQKPRVIYPPAVYEALLPWMQTRARNTPGRPARPMHPPLP